RRSPGDVLREPVKELSKSTAQRSDFSRAPSCSCQGQAWTPLLACAGTSFAGARNCRADGIHSHRMRAVLSKAYLVLRRPPFETPPEPVLGLREEAGQEFLRWRR